MRVKLTVHIDAWPAGVEGVIIEFQTNGRHLEARQAAELFRTMADQYRAAIQVQTPAPGELTRSAGKV